MNGVLVCQRVADQTMPHVASRVDRCGICDAKLWVALSSTFGRARWCVSCAAAEPPNNTKSDRGAASRQRDLQQADGVMNDLNEFKAERAELFGNPTLEAATAHWNANGFPAPVQPDVPLAMVHKARLHWLDATDAMLAESAAWLRDNGYQTTLRGGRPLTPIERDAQRMMHGKAPLAGAQ